MQEQSIPVLRITPSSLVVYNLNTENYTRSQKQVENESNLTRGEFNGYMSPKTKSKVKRYLDTWINCIDRLKRSNYRDHTDKKPYLTFVTLTLPSKQNHTDNQIKRQCLTPFIETLKRKYDVWNYFWRAEAQENGNIHFHIIIDSYIEWRKLRRDWNDCINKLGYVDTFKAKFGHDNPNSTDIHKLNEIRSIISYVIKYCTKSDGYRPIEGRIHGCSDNIRTLTPYEIVLEAEDYDLIALAVEDKRAYVRQDVCFTYIAMPVLPLLKQHKPQILKDLNQYYLEKGINLYTRKDTFQTIREQCYSPNSSISEVDKKRQIELTDQWLEFRIEEFDKY